MEHLLLPDSPNSLEETVVSLPAVALTYEELLDVVLGLTVDENAKAQADVGKGLLREKVAGLREVHEIATRALDLLDSRLKLLEEMAAEDWYLARRPK